MQVKGVTVLTVTAIILLTPYVLVFLSARGWLGWLAIVTVATASLTVWMTLHWVAYRIRTGTWEPAN